MADRPFHISDAAIREIQAHEEARERERREAELIERVATYITGPAPVRAAAAREIVAMVREDVAHRGN